MHWDLLIRGARVFDGAGSPGRLRDVAIRDGRIAAFGVSAPDGGAGGLPVSAAAKVEDASGAWMLPGLIDIHTHEDLEVELAPGLPEVVRHGTTSVIVGNCSIGMAFGAQRTPEQDPIVDCFARVENIPKTVLRKAADQADWTTPAEYLAHLDSLPLAASMAPLLPHSMLRIEVMGLAASISRDPSAAELNAMVGKLERAMEDGYIGFSTDGLPLHFLASRAHLEKRIPTQYA
ncbi:MAG: amidohydrolase family protein, partial [Pseudomonadales bacterium]|nr:amidohydrolase family protein [Pseudomonadales bacterium]